MTGCAASAIATHTPNPTGAPGSAPCQPAPVPRANAITTTPPSASSLAAVTTFCTHRPDATPTRLMPVNSATSPAPSGAMSAGGQPSRRTRNSPAATPIAAIGVAAGEFLVRLLGWPPALIAPLGAGLVALFTGINLVGVASGRWVQNVVTAAKLLALGGVVVIAFARGTGAGWHGALPGAPVGLGVWVAIALAAHPVIWTYYGYPDLAKIAGEVVDPSRTLPRILLGGLAATAVLYLALNAAFLQVLPLERIAASNLVAADVMDTLVGARGGALVAGLALLVVLASLNGNVFVTPRVLFGLARDGLAPGALARVNAGGTPWVAMLAIGVFAIALAATGTFELLLGLAIVQVLVIDSWAVIGLFRLRGRDGPAPFSVPGYPWLPLLFVAVYAALFAGTVRAQPTLVAAALAMLGVAYALSWIVKTDGAAPVAE